MLRFHSSDVTDVFLTPRFCSSVKWKKRVTTITKSYKEKQSFAFGRKP